MSGYFLIEARWESAHNAPGDDTFVMIDQIGGSLDDAKRAAQTYLYKHAAQSHMRLEWLVGVANKSRCYYARASDTLTLRITG